jgi:transposase
MPKNITKSQFHHIMRNIKQHEAVGTYTADMVAAEFGVSSSTVRAIRRSKTYPGFVSQKQRRHSVPDRAQATATRKLSSDLKKLEATPVEYVTTKQLTDAIDSFDGKIKQERIRGDIHRKELDELKANARVHTRILNRVQQLKPRWFREG